MPAELRSVAEPEHQGLVLHGAGEHAGVSIGIFINNIQVTFLAYAGGITLGLLTGYVLATNGILLGAVAGLATGAGNGGDLLRLIVGHGVLELSCIAVAAAAGLRVGWSLVEPGPGTRAEALRAEAARSVGIVLGTMPWLVLAGLVEGFVTGSYSTAVVLPRRDRARRPLLGTRASRSAARLRLARTPLTQAPAKRSGRRLHDGRAGGARRGAPRARAPAASRARRVIA